MVAKLQLYNRNFEI